MIKYLVVNLPPIRRPMTLEQLWDEIEYEMNELDCDAIPIEWHLERDGSREGIFSWSRRAYTLYILYHVPNTLVPRIAGRINDYRA